MFFVVVLMVVCGLCSVVSLGNAVRKDAPKFDKTFGTIASLAYIVLAFVLWYMGVK